TEQTNAALSFDSDACRQYNAARCLIPDRYDQAISPPAATLHGVPAGRQSHPRVREAATDFVPAPTSSAGRETQRRVCLPALFVFKGKDLSLGKTAKFVYAACVDLRSDHPTERPHGLVDHPACGW
ncbi:MAG: hypothetical protein WAU95_21740, partial [Anaerolineae bacterium]